MKVGAVIVAAGRGVRAGGGKPKQWRALLGKTVADYTLQAFSHHPSVDSTVVVMHPDDIGTHSMANVACVSGGETRSASVLAGLLYLEGLVDKVLIHDAARPCVTQKVISDVIKALETSDAAAPAVPVVDALWTGKNGKVTGTADRDGLFRAQTPQGFDLAAITRAHKQFPEGGADDVELARRAGMEVQITQGDEDNLKITLPADFARAEVILKGRNGY